MVLALQNEISKIDFFNDMNIYAYQIKAISGQLLDKKTALLLKWVETSGYKISSKPKYLFYNPPATPGFLKRNEVMLVVNSEKTDD